MHPDRAASLSQTSDRKTWSPNSHSTKVLPPCIMVTKHPLWWYASYQYISKGYIVCHYSCLSVRPWWLQKSINNNVSLMNCILYVQSVCIVLLPTNNIRWSIVAMLKALHRWRGGFKALHRGFRNPGIVLMYFLPLAYIQWFKSNIISSLHAWLRHISQKYLGHTS